MRFLLLLIIFNAAFLIFFAVESETQDITPFPLGSNFSPLPAGFPLGVQYWEKIHNWNFNFDGHYIAYFLYTEPAYSGFYQIIHYQIILEKTNKFGVQGWDFSSTQEKVQWADPRKTEVHRFKLSQKRHWKKLWLGRVAKWEEMSPGSIEFQSESPVIMRLLQIHRDHAEKYKKKNIR